MGNGSGRFMRGDNAVFSSRGVCVFSLHFVSFELQVVCFKDSQMFSYGEEKTIIRR